MLLLDAGFVQIDLGDGDRPAPANAGTKHLERKSRAFYRASQTCTSSCVYRKPHPSVMPRWNRLSWRDDRAVLLRSGRPGLAVQVEVTA